MRWGVAGLQLGSCNHLATQRNQPGIQRVTELKPRYINMMKRWRQASCRPATPYDGARRPPATDAAARKLQACNSHRSRHEKHGQPLATGPHRASRWLDEEANAGPLMRLQIGEGRDRTR